jgi:hypothetical protein
MHETDSIWYPREIQVPSLGTVEAKIASLVKSKFTASSTNNFT